MDFDPSLLGSLLSAEAGLSEFERDPIAAFRFKSEAQKQFTEALSKFDETALRAGNQAGKTTIGSRCGVALARGCPTLDSVPLPLLGAPNHGAVLAKGRSMAKLSVVKAYREAVGRWPHHLEKNGNNVEAIWVKPNASKSDDWADWSCIRFFMESGQSVAGMRLAWVHADEPPDMEMWGELRMRHTRNRRLVRFITFTPIDKREWLPLRTDFKGCAWPKGKAGKVEITMSVYDNKALGPEHIKAVEQAAGTGLLSKARLLGDWVDLTGSNPFDAEGLKVWSDRCQEPTAVEQHITSKGNVVEWQRWGDVVEGESYLVVADPSMGIADEADEHDPCEVVVVSRGVKGRPAVVARYNGYIPAYELGRLSLHLAKKYNGALLVVERNSGYAEAFLLACGDYGNLYIEYHKDSLHLSLAQRIGWTTTATTRGTIIGALQKAVLQDGLLVYSADAVESLKNVIVKKDGIRMEAGPGAHDEDMIVLGIACHLLETYPIYTPSNPAHEKTDGEKWLARNGFKLEDDLATDPFNVI